MKDVCRSLAVVCFLVWGVPLAASAEGLVAGPTLGTPDQRALEERMLWVLASPEVRRQRVAAKEIYASHALAATPDGAATLEAALDSITAAMVLVRPRSAELGHHV